jgi:hypothetical protein
LPPRSLIFRRGIPSFAAKIFADNWRMRNRENAPQTLLSRAISFLEHNARGRDLVKGGLASNYDTRFSENNDTSELKLNIV